MLEKSLHTGNIAASFAVLATTFADITLAGGISTVLGAALSGVSIFKGRLKAGAKDIAVDLNEKIKTTHLSEDQEKWLRHHLALFPPTDQDVTAANMDGVRLANVLIERIKAEAKDPELRCDAALDGYKRVMPDVFQAAIDRDIASNEMQSAMLKELMNRSEATGASDKLRDEGITEKAIIRLAQRIAAETDDLGQAWLELQNAMDIAVRVQAEGIVGSNHGDFVDEVLKRATDLAREGEYATAGAAIDDALEQADAQIVRLLNKGVDVALLDRDTARAAALLVRKADVEAGGTASLESLRALRRHHYEIGRDQGRNLTSLLSIDLAQLVCKRAIVSSESGTALNDLGIALTTLGEREAGTERLEQAVEAYTDALKERTRDRVPLDWAMTKMNLGIALKTLGERETGTERLEQAVEAYTDALKERTRDRVPLQWAMTKMNLGTALQTLGERETGTERLEQAVEAYTDALTERTRDRVPLDWAMTKMNLGIALKTLGERETGTERLEQAVEAYTDALKEYARDRVPFQWAMTQHCLSGVEISFYDKTQRLSHLDAAKKHALAALEVYEVAKAEHYVNWVKEQHLAGIKARREAHGKE